MFEYIIYFNLWNFSGDVMRLSVGGMIALPSGAGVALSVLGGNAGQID